MPTGGRDLPPFPSAHAGGHGDGAVPQHLTPSVYQDAPHVDAPSLPPANIACPAVSLPCGEYVESLPFSGVQDPLFGQFAAFHGINAGEDEDLGVSDVSGMFSPLRLPSPPDGREREASFAGGAEYEGSTFLFSSLDSQVGNDGYCGQNPLSGQFAPSLHVNNTGEDVNLTPSAVPGDFSSSPLLPAAQNDGMVREGSSSWGIGHGGYAVPTCSLDGQGGVSGYADVGGGDLSLCGNLHQIGVSSLPRIRATGVLSGGPTAGFGYLRDGYITGTNWTDEEQTILERGLVNYAHERNDIKYAHISLNLGGHKSIRDVAMRCKYWIEHIGDCSADSTAHSDAQNEHVVQKDLTGVNAAMTDLFEQNDLIFGQIIQNQALLKIDDNINLFADARRNICMMLSSLDNNVSEDASKMLKKMGPLHENLGCLIPPS